MANQSIPSGFCDRPAVSCSRLVGDIVTIACVCVYVGVSFYILRFGVDSTENHNKTEQKKKDKRTRRGRTTTPPRARATGTATEAGGKYVTYTHTVRKQHTQMKIITHDSHRWVDR